MADTVLIVDDDETVFTMFYKVIRSNGIKAGMAASGEEVLERTVQRTYDLILLDVNPMGTDGFQVIQTFRQWDVRTPIIIANECKEDYDTLYGLGIGASNYVAKPFNLVTLRVKVEALIRRDRSGLPGTDSLITAGSFTYNTSTLHLYKNGVEILPSAKENAMMKLLTDNIDHIFSKDTLYDLFWGEAIIDENVIMVYINCLWVEVREDPAHPAYVQAVRGPGYRFTV